MFKKCEEEWMVEIGQQHITVGPFKGPKGQLRAFAWQVTFVFAMHSRGQLRTTRVRENKNPGRFFDVDLSALGESFTSPAAVARDIGCYEHCHAEVRGTGAIPPAEHAFLAREFDSLRRTENIY